VGEITEQREFLNAVARIETALEPDRLLDVCKGIEAERGRMFAGPRHGPRPLDLDLLLLGDLELASERLTIPHPQITERRFVLVPLLELDPELALPNGTRLAAALAALGAGQRVDRVGGV
jgi:2-amino-4-hydroxy-6-hydroxymethyldihydropteridine diphosphokinase